MKPYNQLYKPTDSAQSQQRKKSGHSTTNQPAQQPRPTQTKTPFQNMIFKNLRLNMQEIQAPSKLLKGALNPSNNTPNGEKPHSSSYTKPAPLPAQSTIAPQHMHKGSVDSSIVNKIVKRHEVSGSIGGGGGISSGSTNSGGSSSNSNARYAASQPQSILNSPNQRNRDDENVSIFQQQQLQQQNYEQLVQANALSQQVGASVSSVASVSSAERGAKPVSFIKYLLIRDAQQQQQEQLLHSQHQQYVQPQPLQPQVLQYQQQQQSQNVPLQQQQNSSLQHSRKTSQLSDKIQQQQQQQQQLQQQQQQQLQQQQQQLQLQQQQQQQLQKQTEEEEQRDSAFKNLFTYHYVIGKGGFGKVWKVEHRKNKQYFALKEMSKALIITKKSVNSVMNERNLLSMLKHPFIVNMFYAYQDRDNLYLIMDLMPGGDLRYHIGRQRRFSEEQTRFFVCCIFLGLEYLHNNNIIHRDIKPENLVLDSKGYVRITDLGIARFWKADNSQDTSGTPGYMAPEVMCRQPHSFAVDYFALGVLAYEFMLGRRPYLGRSRKEIRDQILAKRVQIKKSEIPSGWSLEAADFINRMIERKPANRLGINGPAEVKSHPWIKNFPWQKLYNKELEAPFLPGKTDNFDSKQQVSLEDEQNAELIAQNSILLKKDSIQSLFNGYNFESQQNQIVPQTGPALQQTVSSSQSQTRPAPGSVRAANLRFNDYSYNQF